MKRLIALSSAIVISACANFHSIESSASVEPVTNTIANSSAASTVAQQLNTGFHQYQGVPYRYGGTDRNGFDCSGFINAIYRDAFNITLPKTTEALAIAGTPVRRDQLKAGDIIFFKSSQKQLHAGIYTTQGAFIHASTSKGVIQSSLSNQYWHLRYLQARRIL